MSFTRRLPLTFALALTLSAVAAAQTSGVSQSARAEAPPVTVAATAERVRVSAPAAVVQLRLEVYDEAGRRVFDTEQRGGSVLDWHLQGGAGERVPGGAYVCVVTIKSLNGRLSQRLGLVEVGEGQATARPFEAAQLSAAQAQAVGPVEEGAGLSVVASGGAGAAAVVAHSGDAGQLARTRGDLSFRVGDFFAGTDREQMRLTEDGRLGIGTDKPEATLDVAGEVRAAAGFRFADGSKLSVDEKGALSRTSAAGAPLPGLGASVSAATANRLAKFADAAGTLADSAVFESGGFVGVGTTAPEGTFHIQSPDTTVFKVVSTGTAATGRAVFQMYRGAAAQATGWDFGYNTDLASENFIVRELTNGTSQERFSIRKGTGNVGIGTSAPTHRLTVGQPENAQFGSAQLGVFGPGFAYAIARDTTNDVEAVFGADFSSIGPASGSAIFGSLTNHGVQFRTNNNLRMVIDAAGNVGIGREVPTGRLTVGGSGLFNAAGAARFDLFNNAAGSGFLQHVSNTGAWQLATTGGATRMLVDTAGNVGVGTVSPTARLTVGGAGSFNAVGAARFDLFNTTAGVGYFQHVFNDGRWQLGSGDQTRILVDTAGNVGIGTGPTSKLTVDGEITSSGSSGGIFAANNPKNQSARVLLDWFTDQFEKDWPRIRFGGSGEGATNGFLIQGPGDSTKLRITNDGRVSIGPSSQAELLVTRTSVGNNERGLSVTVEGTLGQGQAAIFSNSATDRADVLVLRVGTETPGDQDDFISFQQGTSSPVGAIQGNGSGGIHLNSGAADYAEYLPRLDPAEKIEPGEIVGLFGGRVTKKTRGAGQVMAVSTGPIILGNDPGEKARAEYEKVAFIGQVAVRVRGAVKAGDLIIASGLNDGTGIAVSPERITPEQFEQAVGEAWESSADAGVKPVRTAVGLIQRDPTVRRLVAANRRQATRIAALSAQLAALESSMNRELAALKSITSRQKTGASRRAGVRRQGAGAGRGAGR